MLIGFITANMKYGDFGIVPREADKNSSPCTYCPYKAACSGDAICTPIENIDKNVWDYFKEEKESEAEEGDNK